MKTIYKFQIDLVADNTKIKVPEDTQVIHIGEQEDEIYIWLLFDPSKEIRKHRVFKVYGTGFNMPDETGEHIATVLTSTGFAWHVFEEPCKYIATSPPEDPSVFYPEEESDDDEFEEIL